MPPLTLAALISSAPSAIEHDADTASNSRRYSIQDPSGVSSCVCLLPFTSNDGNSFRNDAVFLSRLRIRCRLNPVHRLRAILGTKLFARRNDGASLGNEHSAMPAPDHLGRPGFAVARGRTPRRGGRQQPADEAQYSVGQNGIKDESEQQHCGNP